VAFCPEIPLPPNRAFLPETLLSDKLEAVEACGSTSSGPSAPVARLSRRSVVSEPTRIFSVIPLHNLQNSRQGRRGIDGAMRSSQRAKTLHFVPKWFVPFGKLRVFDQLTTCGSPQPCLPEIPVARRRNDTARIPAFR
jgi:hypothetical protein